MNEQSATPDLTLLVQRVIDIGETDIDEARAVAERLAKERE